MRADGFYRTVMTEVWPIRLAEAKRPGRPPVRGEAGPGASDVMMKHARRMPGAGGSR